MEGDSRLCKHANLAAKTMEHHAHRLFSCAPPQRILGVCQAERSDCAAITIERDGVVLYDLSTEVIIFSLLLCVFFITNAVNSDERLCL